MVKNNLDELMSVGVDIGKDTFQIVGFDPSGQRVLRKQFKRLALVATFENLPRCNSNKATARVSIDRPDTYERLPRTCEERICEQQRVHTK